MKEAPDVAYSKPAMTAEPLSDHEKQSGEAAMYPLDKDNQSYLIAREKKKRKGWRTFTYEIASFVPRDALHGGEDHWLIEKDVPLPFDIRIHTNAKNAVEYAGNSVKARKEGFEDKARRKMEKLQSRKKKAFGRRKNHPGE